MKVLHLFWLENLLLNIKLEPSHYDLIMKGVCLNHKPVLNTNHDAGKFLFDIFEALEHLWFNVVPRKFPGKRMIQQYSVKTTFNIE